MAIRRKSARIEEPVDFFQYEQLALDENHIRLLNLVNDVRSGIYCELRAVHIDRARKYLAISYHWGKGEANRTVFFNNKRFLVRQNLYDALSNFRNRKGKYKSIKTFWIDAICINQGDDVERGQQIQMMQKIFSNGIGTLVWLGIGDLESDKAINFIEFCGKFYNEHKDSKDHNEVDFDFGNGGRPTSWGKENDLVALEQLLSRPWWFRAWIVQEVAVSKTVLVCCGDQECSWEMVSAAAALLMWDLPRLNELLLRRLEGTKSNLSISGACDRIDGIDTIRSAYKADAARGESNSARTLFKLLSTNRDTLATVKRDKCVALAGLAFEGVFPLTVEACSKFEPQTVYMMAASAILKEETQSRLKFLEYAGKPSELSDLPSWVPDWSYSGNRAKPLLFRQLQERPDKNHIPYNSAGSIAGSPEGYVSILEDYTLSALGFVFDTVDGVSACGCHPESSMPIHDRCQEMVQPTASNSATPARKLADMADDLWRTFVMNRDDRQRLPPEEWEGLFFHTLLQLANYNEGLAEDLDDASFAVRKFCNNNKDFRPWGTETLEHLVRCQVNANPDFPMSEGDKMEELRLRIESVTYLRRLCTTRKGNLALLPADTQNGDVVAILFDSDIPVILRPKSDCWKFIGCGYVHGIMESEVMIDHNCEKVAIEIFHIR